MAARIKLMVATLILALSWIGAAPAGAVLTDLGDPITPHGYPAFYTDGDVALELCVPPPAGLATAAAQFCIGDPLDPNPPFVTGEGFYYMAVASIPLGLNGAVGDATIEFAVESTYGGTEEPIDGQQITFARTRIRIDTPVVGTYTITHPYSATSVVFEVGDEDLDGEPDGINMTADIGSANFLDPALAFRGTLTGPIGPYLTWENFDTNPDLQVLAVDPVSGEPTEEVLEQYIGDPNVLSPVVGGLNNNVFRVQGPEGSNLDGLGGDVVETDLWSIMGKVNDIVDDGNLYVYANAPVPNLFAVGPVNRENFFVTPSTGQVAGEEDYSDDYSLGYPHWYQEAVPVIDTNTGEQAIDPVTQLPVFEGGIQLTLCPPGDAMCISDPIIPTDPVQTALMTGGEGFWYFAAATIDVGDDSYFIEFALESTFGGAEEMVDGNQISFARERIRFNFDADTPVATYRVTHPYGERILEGDPDRLDRVRFTSDIGISNLADPDGAFIGALYGIIGPQFLVWDNFENPAAPGTLLGADYPVQDLVTQNLETGLYSYHVGNPNIPHTVTGGWNGNIFRVERLVSGTVEDGEWEIIGQTDQWVVSGKVFDPATFEFNISPDVPIAAADAVTLNMADPSPYIIDVLANDTFTDGVPVTVAVVIDPIDGTAVVNGDGAIIYTPDTTLAQAGGVDTLTYQISQTIDTQVLTSSPAEVVITVIPVETITVDRARFDTRRLRLDITGTSNFPGTILTFHAGDTAAGAVLGTAQVSDTGRWRFRGTATTNITAVTIVSSTGNETVNQALQVR
ncbi:MAG: Ig-like domain-containing protein [Syntrophotaleaceae bacterium]